MYNDYDALLDLYEERVKYKAKHDSNYRSAKKNGLLTRHIDEYDDMVKDYKQNIKEFNTICKEIKKHKQQHEFKEALNKCDKADNLIDNSINTVKNIKDTGTMGIILGYTEASIKILIPIIGAILCTAGANMVLQKVTKSDITITPTSPLGAGSKATALLTVPALMAALKSLKAAKKYDAKSGDKLLDIRRGAVLNALDRLKRQIKEIRYDIKNCQNKYKQKHDSITESSLERDEMIDTIFEKFNDDFIDAETCIALMEIVSNRYV